VISDNPSAHVLKTLIEQILDELEDPVKAARIGCSDPEVRVQECEHYKQMLAQIEQQNEVTA
jgi:hypothetical protein